jgi:Ser/Thr protein kinase RdoA (MazF antagonist)
VQPPSHPDTALWPALAGAGARPLSGGLINDTFLVGGDPPRGVLQRLHPIFAPEVNLDIEAITAHLEARGLTTPRVLPTRSGALWHLDDEGRCWRALSWVPGVTHHKLRDPALAAAAGRLVGRWHRACADLDHRFAFSRPGAHDTPGHMRTLEAALAAHRDHRLFERVESVAHAVLEGWAGWRGSLSLPLRLCHGDLKISNLRFTEAGEGICLLDLDTMGWLPVDVEMGDAWRSWCNPAAEDTAEVRFEMALFEASARAWLEVNPVSAEEREGLAAGPERICLELAARFAADALNERYFGWDPAVAPTRGEHNLLRARGQLALAMSAREQRGAIEGVVRRGPGE